MAKRVLGEEHQNTLGAMNNFAAALRQSGEYEEARGIAKEALEDHSGFQPVGVGHQGHVDYKAAECVADCEGLDLLAVIN